MPKFEIFFKHTIVETLSYIVQARDEETAEVKGQELIEKLGANQDAFAKKTKTTWDWSEENIEIDDIQEV